MNNSILLNVGDIVPLSQTDGPGKRFTIWLQGCSRHCLGCCNQQFLSHKEKHLLSVEYLANEICSIIGIEGITFSGGEPFEQSFALAILCEIVRKNRPELTFFCYSGYTQKELFSSSDSGTKLLLQYIDILVDGPFLKNRSGHYLWRGSSNQKIHFLTQRYTTDILTQKHVTTQVFVSADGVASMNGFNLDLNLLNLLNNL